MLGGACVHRACWGGSTAEGEREKPHVSGVRGAWEPEHHSNLRRLLYRKRKRGQPTLSALAPPELATVVGGERGRSHVGEEH
jgi:hypothetical protein